MFSMFINFLNNEIKVNLNKFADNTKLERVADILNGRATVQRNLYKVEDLANRTCMKFSKNCGRLTPCICTSWGPTGQILLVSTSGLLQMPG